MVGGGEQSAIDPEAEDLERGERRRDAGEFADGDDDDESSQYFSDAEDRSWPSHSRHNSTAYEDYISPCASARSSSCDADADADAEADADGEAAGEHCRKSSCVSECSLDDVDLEAGLGEIIKASPEKAEKNCRICHLGLESAAGESGAGISLGCSCKGDLSYAHKQCADTWFKIRGNKGPVKYVAQLHAMWLVLAIRSSLISGANQTMQQLCKHRQLKLEDFGKGTGFSTSFLLAWCLPLSSLGSFTSTSRVKFLAHGPQ
ncbi:hypothetical protein ACP70R_040287 [Stipagrostis hirtigluma subsp. patula]